MKWEIIALDERDGSVMCIRSGPWRISKHGDGEERTYMLTHDGSHIMSHYKSRKDAQQAAEDEKLFLGKEQAK